MMAALDPLLETQTHKQCGQIIKSDVLIASTTQDLIKDFRQSSHLYSEIPDTFATVLMSLSPRPERLIRMFWSRPSVGASFLA